MREIALFGPTGVGKTAVAVALAGQRRLGREDRASAILDADAMVPAAGQGIVGITVRADDTELQKTIAQAPYFGLKFTLRAGPARMRTRVAGI